MWECTLYINMFYTVPDLGQMRPLTWAQEVDPVGLHRQSTLIIISEIAPKQNAFKFKIAQHKQKSMVIKRFIHIQILYYVSKRYCYHFNNNDRT